MTQVKSRIVQKIPSRVPAIIYSATRIGDKFYELDAERIHKSSSISHRGSQNDWTSLYAGGTSSKSRKEGRRAIIRINPRHAKLGEGKIPVVGNVDLWAYGGANKELSFLAASCLRSRKILKERSKPETMGKVISRLFSNLTARVHEGIRATTNSAMRRALAARVN